MGEHLIDGEFQSDKYPTCPRGKVPLSCKDPTAQDLLWEYAQRRRAVDASFSDDLEEALKVAGFAGPPKLSAPKIPDDPSPQTCWEQLRPGCNEVLRLARIAPIPENERAGLVTIAAVHFFGAAIADQRRALGDDGRPDSAIARQIMELIVDDMARSERPKLVGADAL